MQMKTQTNTPRNTTRTLARAFVSLAALGATVAVAQAVRPPLEVPLEVVRVSSQVQDGKTVESFLKAETAQPGSVLEYRLRAINTSERPLKGVRADLPIPAGTEYLADTASLPEGVNLLASLDGKSFAVPPLRRTVTRAGKSVEETVPANEYRALRWSLTAELPAGRSQEFKARVKVK